MVVFENLNACSNFRTTNVLNFEQLDATERRRKLPQSFLCYENLISPHCLAAAYDLLVAQALKRSNRKRPDWSLPAMTPRWPQLGSLVQPGSQGRKR